MAKYTGDILKLSLPIFSAKMKKKTCSANELLFYIEKITGTQIKGSFPVIHLLCKECIALFGIFYTYFRISR